MYFAANQIHLYTISVQWKWDRKREMYEENEYAGCKTRKYFSCCALCLLVDECVYWGWLLCFFYICLYVPVPILYCINSSTTFRVQLLFLELQHTEKNCLWITCATSSGDFVYHFLKLQFTFPCAVAPVAFFLPQVEDFNHFLHLFFCSLSLNWLLNSANESNKTKWWTMVKRKTSVNERRGKKSLYTC